MQLSFKEFKLKTVKSINLILITLTFGFCWSHYFTYALENPFFWRGNLTVTALFGFLYFFFAHTYGGYYLSYNTISETVSAQTLGVFLSDGVMFVIFFLLARRHILSSVILLILMFVVQILIIIAWSYLSHVWYFKHFKPKPSAIIYEETRVMEDLIDEYGMEKKFDIQFVTHVDEILKDLSKLDDLNSVFLDGVPSHNRNKILKYCIHHNTTVYMVPRIGDTLMAGAENMHMFHLPMLRVERHKISNEYKILKRTFDIVSATALAIAISPIMLITALAIKLYDHGPVLYKQTRLTKNGKEFEVLKFRSMKTDAEKDGVARLSTGENDDRITPIGKIIRACRVDELPQLFNIIKGDMSVVGPRPERPEIAKQYEEEMPEFKLRLQVRAGLTGYAQVYGKYNTTPYNKLQFDLNYISHQNPILDLQIIFATILTLFQKDSTEGVEKDKTTAI